MTVLSDAQALALAVRVARRGLGQTADNPSVGCLIVDANDRLLASAATAPGGRPHAEVVALAQAGAAARGATAYVTLEPCAHQGQVGPCTQALIEAGLARVVVGTRDQNPLVSGQGLSQLRTAGIEVRVLDDPACEELHRGFNRRMRGGVAKILMKIATSADGAMTRHGARQQIKITGQEVQRQVHLLRRQSDLIVTGQGTVEVDQPRFTVRLPGYVGGHPKVKVWRRSDRLSDLAVNQVMIEAGPRLSSALFAHVDELYWFRSPEAFGSFGVRPDFLSSNPLDFAPSWPSFARIAQRRYGVDTGEVWRRMR